MEELWYPPTVKYEPRGARKVTEKEVDFLSNTKVGVSKSFIPRRYKVGQVYKSSTSDVEIIHYQGGETVCVKILDTGRIAEHYPVRAIFSIVKQPKEKTTMQATQQALPEYVQFNQPLLSGAPVAYAPNPVAVAVQEAQSDIVTMTSLELVDYINELRAAEGGYTPLRHDSFLTKVGKVLGNDAQKFVGVYKGGNGQERPLYKLPKREATLMAMSYSNEISAQVYDKMEALEKQAKVQQQPASFAIPQTFPQALRLALEQAELIEKQTLELQYAAPKVAFVDNFVSRGDNLTATAIGKKLNVSAQVLNKWLIRKNALFLDRKHFCQWYIAKGYGVEKWVSAANSTTGKVVSSIYHTPAGAAWIASNFNIREV
jgi:phage antirepressor YoqD-like protein